jgi:EAL and modified HD-GYP domain-containing signal transduction protein
VADLFVGRQPIFDRNLEVIGYELLYRSIQSGPANVTDGDQATTQVILNTFSHLGLESLVGSHKKAYINATRNFLVGKIPIPFPPTSVVLEVLEDIKVDPELIDSLTALSRQGFQIALDDVTSVERISPLLSLANIIKIDLMGSRRNQLADIVGRLRPYRQRLKLLAEKVETQEELEYCKRLGFDYFQGYFLCKPSVVKGKRMDSARLVLMRTLAKIQDPKADFRSLGGLVAQDVSLSYKVLKLVNSSYYSLAKTITAIDQAIALIGMNQLRGWLTLLIMASIENKPHELTNIAMTRAKMCELVARSLRQNQTELFFLVGLFSVLDAMMDMPMQEALADLPLAEEVVTGLLEHKGPTGAVLLLVLAYERGEWDQLLKTSLSPDTLQQNYLDAIRWTAEVSASLQK